MSLEYLGIAGLVFFLSYWLTERFCSSASPLCLLDRPNERSLHTQPTPRTGRSGHLWESSGWSFAKPDCRHDTGVAQCVSLG